jgi:hypothetical protein
MSSERYALESFPGGEGVLLDLNTGSFFRLNGTAALVCKELLRDDAGASERVAARLALAPEQAASLVAEVRAQMSNGKPAEPTPGQFRYQPDVGGSSLLFEGDRLLFSVDVARRVLKLEARLNDLTGPLHLYLRSLIPKLVALLEVPVLHAAACVLGGKLVAFSGKSGAGKTTTARAFRDGGAELISEDLLVLSVSDDGVAVYPDGEAFARRWAATAASRLQSAPAAEISYSPLAEAPRGVPLPLHELWMIDANRRAGADFHLEPLSACGGLLALLDNGFLASSDPAVWRAFLRRCRALAERAAMQRATMPDGREQLGRAARAYIVNSAS